MKSAKQKHFLALLLLVVACLLRPAWATGTGSISGRVTAAGTNPPYPVAGVAITLVQNGTRAQTTSDANGNYFFSGLPTGEYGLKMIFRHTLTFDNEKDIDVNLSGPGSVTENISLIPLLTLNPLCSQNPAVTRHWSLHNPLPVPVSYTWLIENPSNIAGSGVANPGNSTIDTPTVHGDNRLGLLVSQVVTEIKNNPSQPCPAGNITGTVTDNVNSPLPNVLVTLLDGSNTTVETTNTNGVGSYSFNSVLVGTYSLSFSLAGFQSQTISSLGVTNGNTTTAPNTILLAIAPPPGATVNVTVADASTGAGIPNATVTLTYQSGPSATGMTDGNGLTQFSGQPIGVSATVTVAVNDGSSRTVTEIISGGFSAGQNSFVISVPPVPKGSITGVATDVTNNALPNVQVQVNDSTDTVVGTATTLSDGTYTIFGIAAGTYTVVFSLANYQTKTIAGVVVTSGGTTTENANLTPNAPPPASIAVTVIDGGTGLGVAGATVSLTYTGGPTTAPTATTDGNGFVNFDGTSNAPGLVAGLQVAINVTANDCSGRSGTQLIQSIVAGVNPVTMSLGAAPTGTLSGTVTDSNGGSPLSMAQVTVFDANNNIVGQTSTQSNGTYSLNSLAVCLYSVRFSLTGYNTSTQSGVQIVAGSTTSLNVSLTHM